MKKSTGNKYHSYDALLRYARILGFGEIQSKIDEKSGMQAIIAIHSTQRGPAIGGARFYQYHSMGQALKDALQLSYMMTLKAAAIDLPHGGGKGVIIKPPVVKDREAIFRAFGDFVESTSGRYITAMDIGTTTDDMNIIATRTANVIGATAQGGVQCDPSPFTSTGIFRGIQAAVKFKLNRDSLEGLHVAIQGGGKVGYHLAKHLYENGATITMCDHHQKKTQKFKDEFAATIVNEKEIYDVPCDIFAPCAIGGILNKTNIDRISAPIIAGGANNQLAHRKYGKLLQTKGVLYAPDFIINAGGLIQAASVHDFQDLSIATRLIDQLYDRMLTLFERSASLNRTTVEMAELMAVEKLKAQQELSEAV